MTLLWVAKSEIFQDQQRQQRTRVEEGAAHCDDYFVMQDFKRVVVPNPGKKLQTDASYKMLTWNLQDGRCQSFER
jgi:hypothetical protein